MWAVQGLTIQMADGDYKKGMILMPIPDNPQTRQEMYFNAMATGDSSGIPESPQTREEMYLDAIAKNGGGGGGGSSTLAGLTDVDISNPTNGQTLVYNATSGKWENGGSAGGGVLVVHATWGDTPETGNICTLDKTWNEITAAAQVGPVCILDIWTNPVGTMIDAYGFLGTTINEHISGNNTWIVNTFFGYNGEITSYLFVTDSADGYPSYTYQGGVIDSR